MLSYRATALAVAVALGAGLLGSLALRPVGSAPTVTGSDPATTRAEPIQWRVPGAFQTTMPVLGDNILYVSQALQDATAGAISLKVFEPGELMPAFSITDAVRDGKVEAGYTWLGYDQGKVPASALLGAVPFGMEPWEFSAWWYEAGGAELGQALYKPHNIHPLLCGTIGPETAGWFRFPFNELKDLEGLKIRFAGIGGKVLERLGASITMLPGGEIFQALEKGAIDATEFSLPIVDQSLGFNRVAGYNYYPGWHQPATSMHFVVNLDVWNALSPDQQATLEMACTAGVTRNLARSEALQGQIIANFPDNNVSAESLPLPILRELNAVTDQVLEEEAARDPMFRKILDAQRTFRANYQHWKQRAYLPRDF